MRQLFPTVLAACLLAACTPSPAATPTKPVAPKASAATPATLTHDGGVAYANQIPRQVTLALPATLRAASGIVSEGAGHYELLGAKVSLAQAMRDQLGIYTSSTKLVETILGGITNAHLAPDTPVTFPDDQNGNLSDAQKQLPENQLTANLAVAADHALVTIYHGTKVDPANQICAIRYTDQRHGQAVFRPWRPEKDGGRGTIATTFDLDAGLVTADALFDGRGKTPAQEVWRLHLAFAKIATAAAGQPTFTLRTSGFKKTATPSDDGVFEISVNCLGDAGAAGIVAILPEAFKDALKGQLIFAPNDGSEPDPKNTKPHDFYADAQDKDLTPDQASAALKAILPKDDDVSKPYMVDPLPTATSDPLADPAFAFPS